MINMMFFFDNLFYEEEKLPQTTRVRVEARFAYSTDNLSRFVFRCVTKMLHRASEQANLHSQLRDK